MLLTGFDAPIEQVMYIDKRLHEHNLLQAIARVNRVAKGKQRGFIVDYIGLANHLGKALADLRRGGRAGHPAGAEEHAHARSRSWRSATSDSCSTFAPAESSRSRLS